MIQTILLTSHKGVDLHAATALLVMKDRLEGGDRLAALFRCELHTFWGRPEGWTLERLLDVGRYLNTNKHHYGHFELAAAPVWDEAGGELAAAWPGDVRATDLEALADDAGALYDRLLGGAAPDGAVAVDVAVGMIREALEKSGGNKEQAAQTLGISRQGLYKKGLSGSTGVKRDAIDRLS